MRQENKGEEKRPLPLAVDKELGEIILMSLFARQTRHFSLYIFHLLQDWRLLLFYTEALKTFLSLELWEDCAELQVKVENLR